MVTAIIVAGGRGKRMGQSLNKQFIEIGSKEILARTLEVFENTPEIDEIIVVCAEDEMDFCRENIIKKYSYSKIAHLVPGGRERQNSVFNGLRRCSNGTDIVVIHDGARPFITPEIIRESIECAARNGACTAAVPVKDTIKVVDEEGFSIDTPDRRTLYAVQTPQTFKYNVIMEAHNRALDMNITGTDDTMLVEDMGHRVKIIGGSYLNIKITTQEDLIFGDLILKNHNN